MNKHGATFVEVLISLVWLSFGLLFCLQLFVHIQQEEVVRNREAHLLELAVQIQQGISVLSPEDKLKAYARPDVYLKTSQIEIPETLTLKLNPKDINGTKYLAIEGGFKYKAQVYPALEIPVYVQ